MRRGTTGRSGKMTGDSGGEQGFWPSYADMMSALALILFFLMLLSYIQNLITGNDLQNTQQLLADTEEKLAFTLVQVEDAEAELDVVTTALDAAQLTLDLQQEEIAGYSLKIEEQTDTIASQEKLIGDQSAYLIAANKELVEMKNQMQTIAVFRLSILEEISNNIAQVMGSKDKVSIGDNGNIILADGILFDTDSSEIKEESTAVLDKLTEVFYKFLSDPDNAKYVDSIVISGHTDSTGTEEANRKLSSDRANSVVNYLLTAKNGSLSKYEEYFCAAGYGETRPVASNDTEEGKAANRRIEISIILRDDTVLEIVNDYLALEMPESPEA